MRPGMTETNETNKPDLCERYGNPLPPDDGSECAQCHRTVCEDCNSRCDYCGEAACNHCGAFCAGCQTWSCRVELTDRFGRAYCPACLSDLEGDGRFVDCDRDCDTLDDLIAILRELRHTRGDLPVAVTPGGDASAPDGLWVTDAFDKDSDGQLVFVGEGRGGAAVLLPARA